MIKKTLKMFNIKEKMKKILEPMSDKENNQPLLVGNPKTAILLLKVERKSSCSSYNPFGMCTILDCLQCENSVYKIVFDNDICLETSDFDEVENKIEKYYLEFQDEINRDIFEYLIDNNSNYRIIRVEDNMVLRTTREEFFAMYRHYPKVSGLKGNNTNRTRLVLKKNIGVLK